MDNTKTSPMDITYEGYLIEKKLGEVLDIAATQLKGLVLKRQFRIGNQRCDFAFVDKDTEKLRIVYEFDGPSHYQSSHTFELDRKKDDAVIEAGGVMIRIPYFVQLSGEALNYYLPGLALVSNVEFPHGFISKKAPLPTSFTDKGLHLFCYQLARMPRVVAEQIWSTLISRGIDENNLVFLPNFVFERIAKEEHGDKYDYSEIPDVVYFKKEEEVE